MVELEGSDLHRVQSQSRVHLAAATLVGLFVVFLGSMVMYYYDPNGAGAKIFENSTTTVPPIVTLILGYYFGSRTGKG